MANQSPQMNHRKTSACLGCDFFEKCTKTKKGRPIERSQHTDLLYENKV
jgi:hypothetical protein